MAHLSIGSISELSPLYLVYLALSMCVECSTDLKTATQTLVGYESGVSSEQWAAVKNFRSLCGLFFCIFL